MPDDQVASLPGALAVPLSGDLPPAPPADHGRADSRYGPELDVAVPAPVKDAIAAALAHHAYASRGAYAANTERAFRADTAIFTGWCAAAGLISLPAEPGIVAAFIDAMGDAKAPATVRRYVASIAACHRAARLPNPCGDDTVRLALKRLHRAKGRAQAQAAPLTRDRVEIMLAAGGDGPRALRNRALLAVAYDSLCRRSELVVLGCGDVQAGPHDDGTLTLRRSKTDQEARAASATWPRTRCVPCVHGWMRPGMAKARCSAPWARAVRLAALSTRATLRGFSSPWRGRPGWTRPSSPPSAVTAAG